MSLERQEHGHMTSRGKKQDTLTSADCARHGCMYDAYHTARIAHTHMFTRMSSSYLTMVLRSPSSICRGTSVRVRACTNTSVRSWMRADKPQKTSR